MGIKVILVVGALVCFLLAAFGVTYKQVNFMNLGFAFLTATLLV